MISAQEIATLIESPELITEEQLSQLLKLSEDYPFSPIFSQLYLSGLSKLNPVSFEKELKHFAFRVPDRSQLYQLVNRVHRNESSLSEETESFVEVEVPDTVTEDVTAEHSDHISNGESNSNDDQLDGVPETSYAGQSEEESVEEERLETETEERDEVNIADQLTEGEENVGSIHQHDESGDSAESDPLEKDILAHAVSSSIFLEIEDGLSELSDDHSPVIQASDQQEDNDESAEFVETQEEVVKEIKVEDIDDHSDEVGENRHSFTGWMSQFLEEESTETDQGEAKSGRSTIKKETKPFFSPVRKAKESLDESRLPVSETLAKVYAAQGNYPKAIEAYQKLLLNFPEKKSFFALQIESLKRKLK